MFVCSWVWCSTDNEQLEAMCGWAHCTCAAHCGTHVRLKAFMSELYCNVKVRQLQHTTLKWP